MIEVLVSNVKLAVRSLSNQMQMWTCFLEHHVCQQAVHHESHEQSNRRYRTGPAVLNIMSVCSMSVLDKSAWTPKTPAAEKLVRKHVACPYAIGFGECNKVTPSPALLLEWVVLFDLVVIGLSYMAYPDGCRHDCTFLPGPRPYPMRGQRLLWVMMCMPLCLMHCTHCMCRITFIGEYVPVHLLLLSGCLCICIAFDGG